MPPKKRPEGPSDAGQTASLLSFPLFPGVLAYERLHRGLLELGMRHVGDLLRPDVGPGSPPGRGPERPGGVFMALDGLWFRARHGLGWERADLPYLAAARLRWEAGDTARAGLGASLVAAVEGAARADPMGPRRLMLYQLACLLRDHPAGVTAKAALDLGVAQAEADLLAVTVAERFWLGPGAQWAAQHLLDAWHGCRLHEFLELADAVMPSDARTAAGAMPDELLAQCVAAVRAELSDVERLLAQASGLLAIRAPGSAAGPAPEHPPPGTSERRAAKAMRLALRAARMAADHPAAVGVVLEASARLADAGAEPGLLARLAPNGHVTLTWDPARHRAAGARISLRILRMQETQPPVELALLPAAADGRRTFVDQHAPAGAHARYAVVPMRDGVIIGTPRVSRPVQLTPDLIDVRLTEVPHGLSARWRLPPGAAAVRIERFDASGRALAATVLESCDGHVDRPLPAGTYEYRLCCGFSAKEGLAAAGRAAALGRAREAGGLHWSDGVRRTATVRPWPAQAPGPKPHLLDGGRTVRLAWAAPDNGDVRLVRWSGRAPQPGADLSARLRAHDPRAPLDDSSTLAHQVATDAAAGAGPANGPRSVDVSLAAGENLLAGTVSVLGDRALAGASVLVQSPRPITRLTGDRVARTAVEIRFDWPDPVVLVRIDWSQPGVGDRHRTLARSEYLRAGLVRLTVSPERCRVTVTPRPHPRAALVAAGEPATLDLLAAPTPPPPEVLPNRVLEERRPIDPVAPPPPWQPPALRPVDQEPRPGGPLRPGRWWAALVAFLRRRRARRRSPR